ncbi:hypothetical protein DB347_00640 [Opitutaceae bacterium EW11]|nr:hypothetical protein DB347_00640 [Opitutaceae bacterium EW11]
MRSVAPLPLVTIPHLSWLHRLCVLLGGLLALVGAMFLLRWGMQWEEFFSFGIPTSSVPPTGAASILVFGVALIGYCSGCRRLAVIALVPAAISLATLVSKTLGWLPTFDEVLVPNAFGRGAPAPSIHTVAAIGFLLSGLALAGMSRRPVSLGRTVFLAFSGSILASIAFSTLLGYGFGLPVLYRWGTTDMLPIGGAISLFILGVALLALAWREHQGENPGAPGWIPMPVVVGAATLTGILWMSLRESERLGLAGTTQIAIRDYASAIGRELQHQCEQVDRLAQHWSRSSVAPEDAKQETITVRNELLGCEGLTRLDPDGHVVWEEGIQGSVLATGFEHATDAVRNAAMHAARGSGTATISGSIFSGGAPIGFAIYTPIEQNGQLDGYLGADIAYRRLFLELIRRLKLENNYQVAVYVGPSVVYSNTRQDLTDLRLEEVFDVADRRIRVEIAPTQENMRRSRRYLPELALGAGLGITLLLGLSVHLARAARSGLRAARLSNIRLVAENEERRRVEEMLKVSDEQLRLALDSTQIGIFEWKLPDNHLFSSASIWSLLGYPPGVVPPTQEAWTALIHPDDLPSYHAALEKQLSGKATFIDPEYRIRTYAGAWKWIYTRARTVAQSKAGTPTRVIGTLQDITARKLAEQALRLSQATTRKLSLVAAKTDNLVLITTAHGAIEWANESFERVMEYPLSEVIGKNPADFLIGSDTAAQTVRRIRVAFCRGLGVSTDIVNYSKSGKKFHLHLEIQPVHNEAGVLENFIAVMADISSRVETERTLRRAKAEADAASKAKSEFLASMSHEIRTPMNGVIGMTSLLLDTPLTHEQRDCVSTIRSSGEALLTIINDILDFSKIESGRMDLEKLPFELAVCIEDALDLFSVQATNKKLELVYHIDSGVPSWIQGDATRLRQVLVNLVNNAVKFTPSGSVSIRVACRPAAPPAGAAHAPLTLEFSVTDTGIGIPADRLDRLFRPFSQVDSSTTRKYGGTGLGLAISHRLCALMGGSITVHSTLGVGSTFSFTIQTEALTTPAGWGLPDIPSRLKNGTVLCIDDHPVTRERLKTLFASWGARPECAATAQSALPFLAAATPPVAIVLDYGIPEDEAGIELRARICGSTIPVLLLLPPGQSAEDLEVFAGRRGTASVVKPARTHALIRGMQNLLDAPVDSLPPFAPSVDSGILGREIPLEVLVVEDNAVNQKVALRFLERLGYRADAVGNGAEAVHTLESRRYHLVLMDLQMPEMDGFEATRQIRKLVPAERQPKIIALTANALSGDRDLCLAAGMDDYITKPVKLLEIAQMIRRQFLAGSRPPLKSGKV